MNSKIILLHIYVCKYFELSVTQMPKKCEGILRYQSKVRGYFLYVCVWERGVCVGGVLYYQSTN